MSTPSTLPSAPRAADERELEGYGDGRAEDCLRAAMHASTPTARRAAAEAGLAVPGRQNPTTLALLERQRYRACLDEGRLDEALTAARRAASFDGVRDIAQHDVARVLWAQGQRSEAIGAQRLAARHAPAARRSFHLWNLATFQQHAGQLDASLATLRRALRASLPGRDRPLIRAHRALVRLEAGRAPRGLQRTLDELAQSTHQQGYGGYLLGMIHHRMGEPRMAEAYLRAFLRRHARTHVEDPAKELTLRTELQVARQVLAELVSD